MFNNLGFLGTASAHHNASAWLLRPNRPPSSAVLQLPGHSTEVTAGGCGGQRTQQPPHHSRAPFPKGRRLLALFSSSPHLSAPSCDVQSPRGSRARACSCTWAGGREAHVCKAQAQDLSHTADFPLPRTRWGRGTSTAPSRAACRARRVTQASHDAVSPRGTAAPWHVAAPPAAHVPRARAAQLWGLLGKSRRPLSPHIPPLQLIASKPARGDPSCLASLHRINI